VAGLLLFIATGLRKNSITLLFSGCFTGVAFIYLWAHFWDETVIYWPNAFAVVLLLGQQQLAKRHSARFALPEAMHSGPLWLATSRPLVAPFQVGPFASGRFLPHGCLGFLALLLFNAGFLLRERVYRWAGLALLGWDSAA